jgi:hypothetical protein
VPLFRSLSGHAGIASLFAMMQTDPEAICEECLRQGAFRFEGKTLCLDCYTLITASCCADRPEESRP